MDFLPIAIGIGVAVAVIGGIVLIVIKSRGVKEEYEIVEEEAPVLIKVEEEEKEGCPEKVKTELLKKQEKIYHDAHKVYLVINNLLRNKKLPAELKRELDTFMRSCNRIRELKEEIEVYPFADCERVFELKFNFYNKLIKETAQKIMVMARSVK